MSANPIVTLLDQLNTLLLGKALDSIEVIKADTTNKLIASTYNDRGLVLSCAVSKDLTTAVTRIVAEDELGHKAAVTMSYDIVKNQKVKAEIDNCSYAIPSVLVRLIDFVEGIDIAGSGLPGDQITIDKDSAATAPVDYYFQGHQNQTDMSLALGAQSTLVILPTPDAQSKHIWQTTRSSVVTVEAGVIKGVGVGSAVITAGPFENGVRRYITICVAVS